MSNKLNGFYAYPSIPSEVGLCIDSASAKVNSSNGRVTIKTWKQLDIIGHFISGEVLSGINEADFLIADITELNFNVTYEIGYAIGRLKRVYLTRNSSVNQKGIKISDVGIFDTLGYKTYQNSQELQKIISDFVDFNAIDVNGDLNIKSPVYIINTPFKTD
ncbi:hypothetical protein [Serratia sp. 201]